MKNLVLTVLSLLFLAVGADAQTIVNYRAGIPVSMTTTGPGYMRTVPVVNGSASAYSGMMPRGAIRPIGGMHPMGGMRPLPPMSYRTANTYNYNRYSRRQVNNVTNTVSQPVSRLNRNYTIPQRSSYTRNGVTYYN